MEVPRGEVDDFEIWNFDGVCFGNPHPPPTFRFSLYRYVGAGASVVSRAIRCVTIGCKPGLVSLREAWTAGFGAPGAGSTTRA
jgi:hypothetical protein